MLNKRSFEFSRNGLSDALNYTNEVTYKIKNALRKHYESHKDLYFKLAMLSIHVCIILFVIFTTMPNPQPYANPLAPLDDYIQSFRFMIGKF